MVPREPAQEGGGLWRGTAGGVRGILGMSSGRGQVWVEEGIKLGCVSADLRVL